MAHENRLSFDTESLPGFPVGVSQQFSLQVSGGTQPYTFVLTQGALPPDLSLSAAGEITGAVTAKVPDSTIVVQVTDNNENHTTQDFTVQTFKK